MIGKNKISGSSMTFDECRYFQSDGIRKSRCDKCNYLSSCEIDWEINYLK